MQKTTTSLNVEVYIKHWLQRYGGGLRWIYFVLWGAWGVILVCHFPYFQTSWNIAGTSCNGWRCIEYFFCTNYTNDLWFSSELWRGLNNTSINCRTVRTEAPELIVGKAIEYSFSTWQIWWGSIVNLIRALVLKGKNKTKPGISSNSQSRNLKTSWKQLMSCKYLVRTQLFCCSDFEVRAQDCWVFGID